MPPLQTRRRKSKTSEGRKTKAITSNENPPGMPAKSGGSLSAADQEKIHKCETNRDQTDDEKAVSQLASECGGAGLDYCCPLKSVQSADAYPSWCSAVLAPAGGERGGKKRVWSARLVRCKMCRTTRVAGFGRRACQREASALHAGAAECA